MKKGIVMLVLILFTCLPCWANGWTVWGLSESDLDSTQAAITGRVGYQYENLEAFIGSTWRPNFRADPITETVTTEELATVGASPNGKYDVYELQYSTDEYTYSISPPQVMSVGLLHHLPDIVDSNSPYPWLPELLLTFVPEEWVAMPYWGGQFTINVFDKDAGFYGGIAGILAKTNPDSKAALVAEAQFNEFFDDLQGVPDEWRLNIGFRFYFD